MSIDQWTATASGGVAVVVLRGAGGRARLGRLGVTCDDPGAAIPAGPRLVRLESGGEQLDEALLVQRAEDQFEVHLHGSPPLVSRVLSILRAAGDGEPELPDGGPASSPSERAWERLADAPSELGARILLDQAEGAFEAEVQRLGGLSRADLSQAVADLREHGRRASFLLNATTIALTGPVNAGKSTLFNLLVGSERTLVSADQGTTRDAIGEGAHLGAWPVLLVDTAGRRELPEAGQAGQADEIDAGAVERAGQRLAERVGREADWSLDLCRATGRDAAERGPAGSTLWTCCDELGEDPGRWPHAGVSALAEPERAVARVQERFETHFELSSEPTDLWSPGRAVPFEPAQLATLAELEQVRAEVGSDPTWEQARTRLLEGLLH